MHPHAKPFPIPLVAAPGAGHLIEDEALDYLTMPAGMDTYRAPRLPEPETLAGHAAALRVLGHVLQALRAVAGGGAAASVSLAGLAADDLALVNQVLGEGEVSAQVLAAPGSPWLSGSAQIQEAVFAGVWRVLRVAEDGRTSDHVEVGAVPALLREVAREDARRTPTPLPVPEGMVNLPAILHELAEHRQHWRAGQGAQVVNLTLLPLGPEDIAFMDHQLGTGRVLILSRGYGNCRITNACVAHTWRVVYYNSQDTVILNSVEVCDMPEVACAAPEDLADSAERLAEVLAWVEQGNA